MPSPSLPEQRRRLGPLRRIEIEAASLPAAHGRLGEALGPVIRRVAARRLRATSPADFDRQIDAVRNCRRHVSAYIRSGHFMPRHVRRALREYLACLDAWAHASQLESVLDDQTVDGKAVTARELALWLQDDNSGCQTGLLRLAGGDVLFWHTEEDTIGYFDRPRLASLLVGKQTWHAFLYPYLLPGPAFGWQAGRFHAVDSLHIRRGSCGAFTNVAAWLAWRLPGLEPGELFHLCPFLDGCAIHRLVRSPGGVAAWVQELGGEFQTQCSLPLRQGSLLFQANCVRQSGSRLAREEALSAAERKPYCDRRERTEQAVRELVRAGETTPQRIVELLASRAGGDYAYANSDVKAHCVGVATAAGMELYVQSGAALPGDKYRPQFHA